MPQGRRRNQTCSTKRSACQREREIIDDLRKVCGHGNVWHSTCSLCTNDFVGLMIESQAQGRWMRWHASVQLGASLSLSAQSACGLKRREKIKTYHTPLAIDVSLW